MSLPDKSGRYFASVRLTASQGGVNFFRRHAGGGELTTSSTDPGLVAVNSLRCINDTGVEVSLTLQAQYAPPTGFVVVAIPTGANILFEQEIVGVLAIWSGGAGTGFYMYAED